MLKNKLKIGIIGGSKGLGNWIAYFFKNEGFFVCYNDLIKNKELEDKNIKFKSKEELIKESDIIILAVPINKMTSVLEEIFPYLNKYSKEFNKKLLIEICSVKKEIIKKFKDLNSKNKALFSFLSLHPMFGPGLKDVKGQTVLFNYSFNLNNKEVEKIKHFLTKKGFSVFDLDYKKHDKIMALIQGLNHFNIFVSAKVLKEIAEENKISIKELKNYASPSYSIFISFFTRYVLQNEELYSDIQVSNDYNKEVIKKFLKIANELSILVSKKDKKGIEEFIKEMKDFYKENKEDYEKSQKLIEFYSK